MLEDILEETMDKKKAYQNYFNENEKITNRKKHQKVNKKKKNNISKINEINSKFIELPDQIKEAIAKTEIDLLSKELNHFEDIT